MTRHLQSRFVDEDWLMESMDDDTVARPMSLLTIITKHQSKTIASRG